MFPPRVGALHAGVIIGVEMLILMLMEMLIRTNANDLSFFERYNLLRKGKNVRESAVQITKIS